MQGVTVEELAKNFCQRSRRKAQPQLRPLTMSVPGDKVCGRGTTITNNMLRCGGPVDVDCAKGAAREHEP